MNPKKVITRFPPSPTGYLHIGSARTALYNYLFALHNGGAMYLRFEDTDKERSKKEFEDDIVEGLKWLGIEYVLPEKPRQSERTEIYKKYLVQMIENGFAYEAEAQKENPDKKIIRFKNPNKNIIFQDAVRGEVSFDTTELGDFVIAKSVNEPLYHLAVVVDDHKMGVSHVIRGEDHISNTPRQILIQEALGFERPEYAHLPLILAPDKSKLSKRHGAVSVNEYRAQGYLPEALINYLALVGWNPGREQEIFTLPELVKEFTLDRVHKNGAVFDVEKLKWFNHEHIKKLSDEEFAKRLAAFLGKSDFHSKSDFLLTPLIKERAQTFAEAVELLKEYDFLDSISYNQTLLLNSGKIENETAAQHLKKVFEMLTKIGEENFTQEKIKEIVWPYATQEGRGAVLWPLRVALSGKEKSPDPFTIAGLIGKEKTLTRIAEALKKL